MQYKFTPSLLLSFCLSLCLLFTLNNSFAAEGPWRVNDALGLNENFSLSGSHRTRLESVNDSVRAGTTINDDLLTFLTILNAEYNNGGFGAQVEILDARQELADRDSIFGSDSINTLDILQANLNYSFGANNNSNVKVGRVAGDWGSRRLLARHRYGNTINAFDGIEFRQRGSAGKELRILASRPVRKLPSDKDSLLDNERESDESSSAQKFYAAYLSLPELTEHFSTDFYFYSLQENDTNDVNTRNRHINSYGVRLLKPPAAGMFNFEIETVFQTGTRRATTAISDRNSLDHKAFFQYAMIGYSFDVPSRLRILFEFDYASGDSDPFDNDNERFDSLFGVTSFEFARTGIYGAFNRSNVITPGIRITGDLTSTTDLMFSYRHFWLEESKDSWGRTKLRDITGKTDDYLGQHLEARIRWNVFPNNLRIETGGVFLHAKHLADRNSLFGYVAAIFTF